jgi:diacylglycerol O-acyltransferase
VTLSDARAPPRGYNQGRMTTPEAEAPQRLSPQDAVFLHLEGPNTPYHVASLLVFERGEVDVPAIESLMLSRLHLVPRLRQKLATVPLGQGRPVWVDDEHFDVRYHVRVATVPPPGTEEQLLEMCSGFMEQHLSRSRPLWEVYVIDGLEGDRAAIFAKTHHCMVDGVSGLDVASLLLDVESTDAVATPPEWTPRRTPTKRELLTDAVREEIRTPGAALGAIGRLVRRPRRLVETVGEDLAGAADLAKAAIHPVPSGPLNARIGPNRRLGVVRSRLDVFKAIKDSLGGTVNDVVLTAVTGALREWLLSRGEKVEGLELAAMVPVSIRSEGEEGVLGNRVSTIIAPLPVGERDPAERYRRIREGTQLAKTSHQAVGAELLLQVSGFMPPALVAQIARFQNAQRIFNLSITNIAGPSEPLYAAGHRLLDLFPFTPLAGNMSLIVAVVSYAGRMEFGLTADAESLPDLDVIAAALEQSIDELLHVAGLTEGDLAIRALRAIAE